MPTKPPVAFDTLLAAWRMPEADGMNLYVFTQADLGMLSPLMQQCHFIRATTPLQAKRFLAEKLIACLTKTSCPPHSCPFLLHKMTPKEISSQLIDDLLLEREATQILERRATQDELPSPSSDGYPDVP